MSTLVEIPAEDPLVVTGAGLVTPVGRDCTSSAAAIRAGVSRFSDIPNFATTTGAGAVGALAYGLTDDRSGSDRLLAMAIPAAQEALFRAEEFYADLDLSRSRMILSLGAEEMPRYEDFDEEDLQLLTDESQSEALRESVEIIRDGHAGGALALQRAASLLYAEEAKHCVIGAVDSLVEYPALSWLNEKGRLKTDDHPNGFIPGEAAAFLVLERRSEAQRRGAPVLVEIVVVAYGSEKANILSDEPLHGVGLAEVIAPTMETAGGEVAAMLCDLNGEYYRMKEWGLVMPKIFDGSSSLPELWHPAECIGDVGAASSVCYIAVATTALARGYFGGSRLLIWASSDGGGRGSAVVRAPE